VNVPRRIEMPFTDGERQPLSCNENAPPL